jgi:uncharacterized protein YndB with AHSA1/START domain
MIPPPGRATTRTSRVIKASPQALYDAFMDPEVLLSWLPPAEMTGRLHRFDPGVGGGYQMSLFYPATDRAHHGKTAEGEDRVDVRFVALDPPRRILEAVTFVADDPALAGEMTMDITFTDAPGGTEVTFLTTDLPPGVRPEDNDEGGRLSLAQLAALFE